MTPLETLDSARANADASRSGNPAARETPAPESTVAVRGQLLWFHDDPFLVPNKYAMRYEHDGLLICSNGKIQHCGPYESVREHLPPQATFVDHRDKIITPGFVDTHVHYSQTAMIGAYGEKLIEWLQKYVYPEEMKFSDREYADEIAQLFCEQLLRNGTTTALVFCTSHPESVDALFEETNRRGMRMAAGKVLMDRNAPAELLDSSVQEAYEQSRRLIERWHHAPGTRGVYAVTPRFAVACTGEMLQAADDLWRSADGLIMHTHVSENPDEVYQVRGLFPERSGYLDVYHHYGLLGPRAVLAHGVQLTAGELDTCSTTRAAIAHCPTSNLFLGSGRFQLRDAKNPRRQITVGLGTDVGGGTSFSPLSTMSEAYKVAALGDYPLDAARMFYLATKGGAVALGMDHQIGSLEPGYEADFTVLDPKATPLLARRTRNSPNITDVLFALSILGDDQAVAETYVAGRRSYAREAKPDPQPKRNWTLTWSRYDWESDTWLPDQPTPAVGWRAPAIDSYAGNLHCVYNSTRDELHWTVFDGTEWSTPVSLGRQAGTNPSLAAYNGKLYCCYVSQSHKTFLISYDDETGGWSPPQHIASAPDSGQPPTLAAYHGLLYVFLRDREYKPGYIHCATYDAEQDLWSAWRQLWRVDTYDPVAAAPFAGRLYVMYSPRLAEDSYETQELRWTSYDSETDRWDGHRVLAGTFDTARPALTPYNGLLYASGNQWAGTELHNWTARLGPDVPTWSTPEWNAQIHPGTSFGLGLTAYHGHLYAVYFTR
ncbi:guanine deaminase [Haloactinospora alba]|uniref:Guanine deaminase n=1 Tax=Haloactinospora alba TaxID=405555 RepID=A0A543NK12_9ACTN|nr:guanine deaminase [Haloactinospora alba]TQN32203.1 guanine deaminase [Haloactinospora alba]